MLKSGLAAQITKIENYMFCIDTINFLRHQFKFCITISLTHENNLQHMDTVEHLNHSSSTRFALTPGCLGNGV